MAINFVVRRTQAFGPRTASLKFAVTRSSPRLRYVRTCALGLSGPSLMAPSCSFLLRRTA